jgi:hypothetical protein
MTNDNDLNRIKQGKGNPMYLIVHSHAHLLLSLLDGGRDRRDTQFDTLLVVCFRLHMLRQITLRLESKVAVPACVRPEVGVRPDVLLQHGRLLASNAATVANVTTSTATSNVGIVVVQALVATFDSSGC